MKILSTFIIAITVGFNFFIAAEGDEKQSSPSGMLKIVTIDINQVQKGSKARAQMYDQANNLSQNLEVVIEKLQQEAEKRWQELNKAVKSGGDTKQQEKQQEQHRLWVEVSERLILSRRLEIETKVGEIDSRIRQLLINQVIKSYAQEHGIDIILRDTSILYSRTDDVTLEILARLNAQDANFDLELEPMQLDNIMEQIDRQVALEMQVLFPN